jgi:hypothetical protein
MSGNVSVMGVTLPIDVATFKMSEEPVGMEPHRNANGHLVTDRRAIKRFFEFDVVAKGLEEAMMYRELITCRGDYWSFYTDAYSSKGQLVTGTGSWSGSRAWQLDAGETMILPVPPANQEAVFPLGYAGRGGGTLLGWRTGVGGNRVFAWSWRAIETTCTVKRERIVTGSMGALQNYTGSETFTHTPVGQTLTVSNPSSTWLYFNLVWIPRYFQSAQVDALLTGYSADWPTDTNLYPDPPRVLMRSDYFPADLLWSGGSYLNNIIALGTVSEMRGIPHMRNGTWDKLALGFSAKMTEV